MGIRLIGTLISIGLLLVSTLATSIAATTEEIAQGKKLAFDRQKGNCLACHAIDDGALAGDIGPPLVAMKARFPDKRSIRAQIADPTAENSRTIMPPFGKHGILTDREIDLITDYIYTL